MSTTSKALQKVAIVTGASPSSIGFLAAQTLAGPTYEYFVILACRNPKKGNESESKIRDFYGKQNTSCRVQFMPLDLSSRTSIREFVTSFQALDENQDSGLALLVNNAGVGWGPSTPFRKTKDGLEDVMGVNHFGTFLLSHLLTDDLKRGATTFGESRVVVVSSSLHDPASPGNYGGGDDSESMLLLPEFPEGLLMNDDEHYDAAKAYKVSKLCNIWFTYEFQRQLLATNSNVVVHAVSPGWIPSTGLARQAGTFGTFMLQYVLDPWRHLGMGPTRSPEDGTNVMVQAATSPLASQGGQYWNLPKGSNEIQPLKSSAESYDKEKARKLWELSLQTCDFSMR